MPELSENAYLAIFAGVALLFYFLAWRATRKMTPFAKWSLRLIFTALVLAPVVLVWSTSTQPPRSTGGQSAPQDIAKADQETAAAQQRAAEAQRVAEDARQRAAEAQRRAAEAPTVPPGSPAPSSQPSAPSAPSSQPPPGARPPGPPASAPSASTRGAESGAPRDLPAPSRSMIPAGMPYDIVPVFYGTDREAIKSTGKPGDTRARYDFNRARRLELGRALVTVPKVHEVPNVERPYVYRIPLLNITIFQEAEDPKKHFTMKELKAVPRAEYLALVRERLSKSKNYKDHALVFVHGFNTTFDAAVYRAAQLAYDLEFDGAPFVYSWPSKGQVGLTDYGYDRGSAEQAEPYLKDFLQMVTKETGATSVSIIAHSMGNHLLLPVLRDLKNSAPAGMQISQIVLAAPDVDRDRFENLATEIKDFAKGITLYVAANDRALELSKRLAGSVARAGDSPAGGPLLIPGIDTIDVTATSTDILSLNHSGYAEKSELLKDIGQIIRTGVRPPKIRTPKYELVTIPRGQYWRYP